MFINHMLFMLFGGLMFFSGLSSDDQVMGTKKPVKYAASGVQTLMKITRT